MMKLIRSVGLMTVAVLAGSGLVSCNFYPTIIAVIVAFPPHGQAPLTVEFDGTRSQSAKGQIISYRWDFGDGSTSNEAKAAHTFSTIGNYRVKLQVSDSNGRSDTAEKMIQALKDPYPVTVGTDWRVQSFEGMESCDGPAPDASGKRWYERGYDDLNWIELPLHDGNPFYGTNKDFYFRTPIDRVTAQMLRLMEIKATIAHNGAIEVWINGKPVPPAVFGRSPSPTCHVDTGTVIADGVINDYLEPDGTNMMAVHLSTGPSKQAQPFLGIVLFMSSK
jgi:PKD repeat protein